jgi:hypothetical protein
VGGCLALKPNAPTRRCPSGPGGGRSLSYKLDVLAAYDAAPDGEKVALLRREGL